MKDAEKAERLAVHHFRKLTTEFPDAPSSAAGLVVQVGRRLGLVLEAL